MPEAIMILVMSMLHRREVTITKTDGNLASGIVNTLQAEDGSGTSFNVTLDNGTTAYFKRPVGRGILKDPIKSHSNTTSDISPSTLKKLLTT